MNTIVLVHGAWHGNWCWRELILLLPQNQPIININLPGHGCEYPPSKELFFSDYVEHIIKQIQHIPNKIILIGHSYAGFIISAVASKLKEKIDKLIYINAFIPLSGESLFSLSDKLSSKNLNPYLKISSDQKFISVEPKEMVKKFMYNQTNENLIHLDKIQLEPLSPLLEFIQLDNQFKELPKYAIISQNDLTLLAKDQIWMCHRQNVPFTIINSDHSPFLSSPLLLKDLLESIC